MKECGKVIRMMNSYFFIFFSIVSLFPQNFNQVVLVDLMTEKGNICRVFEVKQSRVWTNIRDINPK